ncbi:MAG: YopX family protein [Bacteroidales bacterium]|nr:YopX family protein [Bacteroidales bacterium]MCM1147317.1 YopX family protein [Bacteroidales bacterium]MCM1206249.1 YopX family protein [Bacillota bacterium]
MNRIIKFRGKDFQTGEWLYGDLRQRLGYLPSIIELYSNNGKVDYCEVSVKEDTIGQYTGLKDKNGMEIYEGDIMRSDKYPLSNDDVKDKYFVKVIWAVNEPRFLLSVFNNPKTNAESDTNKLYYWFDEDTVKEFEVIGNIHDNPELLKKE